MLRFASARMPASNSFLPCRIAASISSVPTTRSSVALTGSSTTRMGTLSSFMRAPAAAFLRQSSQKNSGAAGSQRHAQPATARMAGSSSAAARTAVDFAVPFSPLISTPPKDGMTILSKSAFFISSCPTMAEKGYVFFIMQVFPFSRFWNLSFGTFTHRLPKYAHRQADKTRRRKSCRRFPARRRQNPASSCRGRTNAAIQGCDF